MSIKVLKDRGSMVQQNQAVLFAILSKEKYRKKFKHLRHQTLWKICPHKWHCSKVFQDLKKLSWTELMHFKHYYRTILAVLSLSSCWAKSYLNKKNCIIKIALWIYASLSVLFRFHDVFERMTIRKLLSFRSLINNQHTSTTTT